MSEYLFASETTESKQRLRFLPVMVTRLMLSLRKAALSQTPGWSLGEPTVHATMKFAERRGLTTRDEMRLDTFASMQEGTQLSQA
jgi:hypothetical protein